MPCFESWKASEKITAILPTGMLAVWAAACCVPTIASKATTGNKNIFLLIISITPTACQAKMPQDNRSWPAALAGNLAFSLWLRRQGRGRRVLAVEFGYECFSDVE